MATDTVSFQGMRLTSCPCAPVAAAQACVLVTFFACEVQFAPDMSTRRGTTRILERGLGLTSR